MYLIDKKLLEVLRQADPKNWEQLCSAAMQAKRVFAGFAHDNLKYLADKDREPSNFGPIMQLVLADFEREKVAYLAYLGASAALFEQKEEQIKGSGQLRRRSTQAINAGLVISAFLNVATELTKVEHARASDLRPTREDQVATDHFASKASLKLLKAEEQRAALELTGTQLSPLPSTILGVVSAEMKGLIPPVRKTLCQAMGFRLN